MRGCAYLIISLVWLVFAWAYVFGEATTFEKLALAGLWLVMWRFDDADSD